MDNLHQAGGVPATCLPLSDPALPAGTGRAEENAARYAGSELMKRAVLLFLCLSIGALGCSLSQAFIVDQIVAVVNKEVISLSDVERELFFLGQIGPYLVKNQAETRSDVVIRDGIEKMVNHKLLLAEAKRFEMEAPTEEEIQLNLKSIQDRFTSPKDFERTLRQIAMTPDDLRQMVIWHFLVNRFIDQRIRFFIIILPEDISNYYSTHQGEFQGETKETAEKEIEKLLFEQKAGKRLGSYLKGLRTKANIQIIFE